MKEQLKNRSVRDLVRQPRREHSRKPDQQYRLIEEMFDGPYLEMYARQEWPGWDAAGYEVDKFDVRDEDYQMIQQATLEETHG